MKRIKKPTDLGIRIKTALLVRGMTGKELAAQIGKSPSAVVDVINGDNTSDAKQLVLEALGLEEAS